MAELRESRRAPRLLVLPLAVLLWSAGSGLVAPAPRPITEARILEIGPSSAADVLRPGWSRTLRLPITTQSVGFVWEGDAEGAVEVRARRGDAWTRWFEVHSSPDERGDPATIEGKPISAAGPVWLGSAVGEIQVRVTEGNLRRLRLHAIRSEIPSSGWHPTPASATPDQPGIITRAEWGADESWRTYAQGCDGTPEYANEVRYSIVHHTATSNDYSEAEAAAVIRNIYHFHTHANEFCDIAYHFLIDRYGRTYEGRYGGITKAVKGAHAGGFNTGSTGVALVGDHRTVAITPSSLSALERLLAWKLAHHGVDAGATISVVSGGSTRWPEGSVIRLSTVSGHRDVSATACPGDATLTLLPSLRSEVQRRIMSTPAYPLPGWVSVKDAPALLTLDAYGGLHPAGSQSAVPHNGFWAGWSIVRGAVFEGPGGYVVDGWGGVHPFGGASPRPVTSYWEGWDIVRGIARGASAGSGWVLDGYGGIHPYGNAPRLPASGYWHGWDIARSIASVTSGTGGYVLDGWGGLHPFGSAPPVVGNGYWPGWDIAKAVAVRPDGVSGYVLDGWGGLSPFGGAPRLSVSLYKAGEDVARGLVLNSTGNGGWVIDIYGVLWPFGAAGIIKTSMTWTGLELARGVLMAPPGPAS